MGKKPLITFTKMKDHKHVLAIATFLLYALILIFQYPIIQMRVSIYAALPVMIIPFLYGLRIGLLNFVSISFVITPLFLSLIAKENVVFSYFQESGLGIVMGGIATLIIGHIHDLHGRINLLNVKLVELARIDPLTKINNRRAFYESLQGEFNRCVNYHNKPDSPLVENRHKSEGIYSIALLDIDRFKSINDTYGHLIGDKVLIRLAEFLSSGNHGLRETDIVGRFGGEEFIVLLPDTKATEAVDPLNRLKTILKKEIFLSDTGEKFSISFSCGISQIAPDDKAFIDIINRADEALYYAKDHGRDSIKIM